MHSDSFDRLDAILEASIDDLYTEGNFIEKFRNKGNKDPKTKKPRPDKDIKKRLRYLKIFRTIFSKSIPGLNDLISTEKDKATLGVWKKLHQHCDAAIKLIDDCTSKWNNISISGTVSSVSESFMDIEESYADAFFNFMEAKEEESEDSFSGIQSAIDALDGAGDGLDSAGKKKLSKIKKDLESLLGGGESDGDSDDDDDDDDSKSKSKKDDDDDDDDDSKSSEESDDSEDSDEVTEAWMDDFGFDSLW